MNFKKFLIIFSLIILVSGCIGGGSSTPDIGSSTVFGATWTSDGKFGGAYSFDGSNDWVKVDYSSEIALSDAITVSAWVKVNSFDDWQQIVMKGDNNPKGDRDYQLQIGKAGTTDSKKAAFGDGSTVVKGSTILLENTWYHLVGVYDGSELKIYLNGNLDGTLSYPGAFPTSNNYLAIGRLGTVNAEYFDGTIDEVKIYNKTLTGTQISTLYNGGEVSGAVLALGFNTAASENVESSSSDSISESDVPDWIAESIKEDLAKGRLESLYIGMPLEELTDEQIQQVQEDEFAQFLPYSPEWRAFADERGISYTTPSDLEDYGF